MYLAAILVLIWVLSYCEQCRVTMSYFMNNIDVLVNWGIGKLTSSCLETLNCKSSLYKVSALGLKVLK